MEGINKTKTNFISSIDLSSNNYKKTQISNLLVEKSDVFDNSIVRIKNQLVKRLVRYTLQKEAWERKLNLSERIQPVEIRNFDIPLKILKVKNKIYYLTEQYKSISEMRTIYVYKFYEIKIIQLIEIIYPGEYKRKFDITRVTDFLIDRSINLSSINGFQEFDQLRLVNNYIKHSTDFGRINQISEFLSKGNIDPYSLDLFLERIKSKVDNFFIKLANIAMDKL